MSIARYYVESDETKGMHFPGVPLRDIDDDEFSSYPQWLQDSIDASPLYRKTKPKADDRRKAVTEEGQTNG